VKHVQHDHNDYRHQSKHYRVPVCPLQFRHTHKIHTIDSGKQGQRQKHRGEESLANFARAALESIYPNVNFEFTNHMNLKALWDRLGELQPGSVVYFILYDSDVDGVQLNHYSGMYRIRSSSSVPVFGPYDDQLGQGILGGSLIRLTQVGIEMAVTAQEVLQVRPSEVARNVIPLSTPSYDWRQLQAWGIATSRQSPLCLLRVQVHGQS